MGKTRRGGGQVENERLREAVQENNLEQVKAVLKDADPNKFYDVPVLGDRFSLLHIASNNGYTDVARALYDDERTARNIYSPQHGYLPIHLAAKNGHNDIVKFLAHPPEILSRKASSGWTPLMFASANGYPEVVNTLISKGANVDIKHKLGITALHSAAYNGHVEVMKELLKHGANMEAKTDGKQTPLHMAALGGKKEAFKFLVERGANTTTEDENGVTPHLRSNNEAMREDLREIVDTHIAKQIAPLEENVNPELPSDVIGKITSYLTPRRAGKRTRSRRRRYTKRTH